ncbi:MAG: CopD family protein [Gammaproteobacteria bacterium]|nr:CopD family protein [Gammaproteobacteria bacterium]
MFLAKSLHIIAAVIWVGGMFFAYMALRPAAASLLEPPQRLSLWDGVFTKFFFWVWISIAVIVLSGYHMMFSYFAGFAGSGMHIHLMHGMGLLMIMIFMHVYFAPYKRLKKLVAEKNYPEAAKNLNLIRKLVALNLTIGLLTFIAAESVLL